MLNLLQSKERLGQAFAKEMNLKADILKLKHDEEVFWAQRSEISWLQAGDMNSKFRRNNFVRGLFDDHGCWRSDLEGMSTIVTSFFKTLFMPSGVRNVYECFVGWSKKINPRQSHSLGRLFTRSEVEVALSQMAPSKAAGPDGFPPRFLHYYFFITPCSL